MSVKQGWYVLYTRSRHGNKIAQQFCEQSANVHLPISIINYQGINRIEKTEGLLFENYNCEVIKVDNNHKVCIRIGSLRQGSLVELHPYFY